MTTNAQYLNRLIEWSVDYMDYISATVEFRDLLRHGIDEDEAFEIVKNLRSDIWPPRE